LEKNFEEKIKKVRCGIRTHAIVMPCQRAKGSVTKGRLD